MCGCLKGSRTSNITSYGLAFCMIMQSRLQVSTCSVLGFRVLGVRVLGFRTLGFRVLGFRVLGPWVPWAKGFVQNGKRL